MTHDILGTYLPSIGPSYEISAGELFVFAYNFVENRTCINKGDPALIISTTDINVLLLTQGKLFVESKMNCSFRLSQPNNKNVKIKK